MTLKQWLENKWLVEHYAIEALSLTIGISDDDVRTIDAFRKKRNISDYERAGSVTGTEVEELLDLAATVRTTLLSWLRQKRPELIQE